MELYKKLLKRIENGEPIYCNETFAKDLQNIADKHYAKQLPIQGVVKSLKDEGQATLTEYATELINMQENPQDSNKDWKIVVIQNTIGKLYEKLGSL